MLKIVYKVYEDISLNGKFAKVRLSNSSLASGNLTRYNRTQIPKHDSCSLSMKLPNLSQATIPEKKITAYLLSSSHSRGKGKAEFFVQFGFTPENWQTLASALMQHALEHDVIGQEPSPFGTRYIIEGEFQAVDGRRPLIRSIWFINTGSEIPRLVSAYPIKRK